MSDESQQYNIVKHDIGEQIKCKNCENPHYKLLICFFFK